MYDNNKKESGATKDDIAGKIVKRAEALFSNSERSGFEAQWAHIAKYIMPSYKNLFGSNLSGYESKGERKTTHLLSSIGAKCNSDLANIIFDAIFGASSTMAKLKFRDADLNTNASSAEWLEAAVSKMYSSWSESNIYQEYAKALQSYVAFGNFAVFHEPRDLDEMGQFTGHRFRSIHLAELVWQENEEGKVDTAFRKFKLTALQAYERWDEKTPEKIIEALKDDPDKEFTFLQAIFPRKDKNVKLGLAEPKDRPFASYYLCMDHGKYILEEGGYYEFHIYIGRMITNPNEVIGRGIGEVAVGEVATLNKLVELGLDSIALSVRPPRVATMRNVIGTLDLRPGAMSYVQDINDIKELPTGANLQVFQFTKEDYIRTIKEIFFLDKLLLPPRDQIGEMSAYETAQRVEEVQRVLGSTFNRLNKEVIEPMHIKSFKMMLRAGAFGDIPPILRERGINVDVVFINQLARTQNMEDLNNIQTFIQFVGGLAQVKPESLDLIDADAIVKYFADKKGIPGLAVTNDDQLQQIRQQRAQMQQQAMQLEAAVKAADVAAKSSKAQPNPNGGM